MEGEKGNQNANSKATDESENLTPDDNRGTEPSYFMDDANSGDGYVHRDENGRFDTSFMDEKASEMRSAVEPQKVKSDSDILSSMKEGKYESEHAGSRRDRKSQ